MYKVVIESSVNYTPVDQKTSDREKFEKEKEMIDAIIKIAERAGYPLGEITYKPEVFTASELMHPGCENAPFLEELLPQEVIDSMNQNGIISDYAMSFDFKEKIYKYCKDQGIKFATTPFGHESFDFIQNKMLPSEFYKIASGEATNLPLIQKMVSEARKNNKSVVMSTGFSDLREIEEILKIYPDLSLNHCVGELPCKDESLDLLSIVTMRNYFNKKDVGYSSHAKGTQDAILAAFLGANIIEKHFVLGDDYNDSKFALHPIDLFNLFTDLKVLDSACAKSKNYKNIIDNINTSSEIKTKDIGTINNFFDKHNISGFDKNYIRTALGDGTKIIQPGAYENIDGTQKKVFIHPNFGDSNTKCPPFIALRLTSKEGINYLTPGAIPILDELYKKNKFNYNMELIPYQPISLDEIPDEKVRKALEAHKFPNKSYKNYKKNYENYYDKQILAELEKNKNNRTK